MTGSVAKRVWGVESTCLPGHTMSPRARVQASGHYPRRLSLYGWAGPRELLLDSVLTTVRWFTQEELR